MSSGPALADEAGRPAVASTLFKERLPLAQQFAAILTTRGIDRGLLGPREAERVWERHLVNCAVLADLLPAGARVVDVGSGAGLPGLVLAIRRPDLQVDLVESLRRRTDFLDETVTELGLTNTVRVVRGRAEDPSVIDAVGSAHWVTARAVAPIDRLVRWCVPLLRPGGHLLAMKGRSAAEELAQHADAIRRAGGRDAHVVRCDVPDAGEPLLVVSIERSGPRDKKGSP